MDDSADNPDERRAYAERRLGSQMFVYDNTVEKGLYLQVCRENLAQVRQWLNVLGIHEENPASVAKASYIIQDKTRYSAADSYDAAESESVPVVDKMLVFTKAAEVKLAQSRIKGDALDDLARDLVIVRPPSLPALSLMTDYPVDKNAIRNAPDHKMTELQLQEAGESIRRARTTEALFNKVLADGRYKFTWLDSLGELRLYIPANKGEDMKVEAYLSHFGIHKNSAKNGYKIVDHPAHEAGETDRFRVTFTRDAAEVLMKTGIRSMGLDMAAKETGVRRSSRAGGDVHVR